MGARGRLLLVGTVGLVAVAVSAACATLGTSEPEGQNLPTNDVGPFRKLANAEDLGIAPYVLDGLAARSFQEPSILALDTNPASMDVAIYVDTAAATIDAGTTVSIGRTRATDGVSFYGTLLDSPHAPEVVLTAGAAWEGSSVHSPSAVRIGSRIALYYAAAGGIGVAVSNDGVAFLKNPAPVLAPDSSAAWETTPPTAPSVAVFPDQTLHMLYAAGDSIGEATSADGYTWTRVDGDPSTPALDPVLGPSPFAGPLLADASLPFDIGQVTDPCLLPRVTESGRLLVRVLYTGYQGAPGVVGRASAIGYAARYGDAGALVRNGEPVYAVGKHEAAPALFEWSEGSLLYVSQDSTATPVYREIAAGVFPATLTLPTPKAYATSP